MYDSGELSVVSAVSKSFLNDSWVRFAPISINVIIKSAQDLIVVRILSNYFL